MDDWSDILYDESEDAQSEMGQSDSKGAKKKGSKPSSKGVATSFGFRRRPASSSRADDTLRRPPLDNNGNGGSTEELCSADALSGRSTPLARPRKEAAGVPLRTNRFGFRQPTSNKTAKVSDVHLTAESAFSVNNKDKQSTYNNNGIDKTSTKPQLPTQVASTNVTTVVGAAGVPKAVTRQTVILTYTPQQLPAQPAPPRQRGGRHDYHEPRSCSASRAYATCDGPNAAKYTLQSNQLPRPQYPAVKVLDTKSAKQVANNSRKISGSSDGSREGSATDSGVGGECEGDSPRPRRRPRNLEMVMKNAHSFHLRELSTDDLDLMDEAVVTDVAVIPLPKLPSTFDERPKREPYAVPAALAVTRHADHPREQELAAVSTLERYRTRTRERRMQGEEKAVLDTAQPELLNKQNSFIKSSGLDSPATVDSSKESSPSCKSDPATETWNNEAGEAMATRSQDDVSLVSTSSMDEERSRKHSSPPDVFQEVPQKTIVIVDHPDAPHPLLMKSTTSSHHDAIKSIMISSMTSSNYSGISVSTTASSDHVTLTIDETNFDMAALEASTQSLIDDETSPADSLISSATSSDSNNDLLQVEVGSLSSSAYQTADTKTKSREAEEMPREPEKAGSKGVSPPTPGTPTHASGSLSLSDGRDYFDDEIADQPALTLRKNSQDSPSNRANTITESEGNKLLRKSRERIPCSPMSQRKGKQAGARTPSLDTLSSLASDDMMMDDHLALSATSLHSVDDYIDRLDSSFRSGLNSLNEQQLSRGLASPELCAVRQWNRLLEQNNALDRQLACVSRSTARSTASLQDIRASLPVRTARLLQRSRAHTPASDGGTTSGTTSGTDGSASPAHAHTPSPAPAALLQDVVDIKTLLLQLKRVLHEPGDEHDTTSSETLDPLLMCAEPARGNGRLPPAPRPAPDTPDHTADLRRQILYLQSQVEERDRLVRGLQMQMSRLAEAPGALQNQTAPLEDTCNVATQTDRLRPPVATNISNTENSGLVSWNELNGRKLSTYSEAQIKTKRAVANGTIPMKCQCGRRINGVVSGADPDLYRPDSLQLRTNSRVGSRYLQAVTREHPDRYQKRDLSVNERQLRKNALHGSRSRSIENFQNQSLSEVKRTDHGNKSDLVKHHTSYSDLYNGRIEAKSNGHSPVQNGHNGQSTDTDYSSDGGYKSLPSNINCNGTKKVSGIPRRSVESRLFAAKPSVKASAI